MANALQHHVAFQVSVKIVHELKAVQIHQHQRKRPPCASGPFPLRGQRFHEEAMGLHASQTVGDRLFLSFLETQRIVQRAGNQIGQRAQ